MSLKDQYLSLQASLDEVEEDDSAVNISSAIAICNEIIGSIGNAKTLSPYHQCALHTKAALILQHHSSNHQHLRTALECLETVWASAKKSSQKEDASALFKVDIEEVAFHLYYCMYRLNSFKAALEGLDSFLTSHFGSLTDNGPQFQHLRAQLLYNLEQYTAAASIYEDTLESLNDDLKDADGEDADAMLTERSEAVTNLTACYASMPNAASSHATLRPHLRREEDGGNFEQHLNMAMSSHTSEETTNGQWWAETALMLYEAEAALKRAHEDTDLNASLQAAFQKRLSELSGPLTALRRFSQKPEESAAEALWTTVSEHLTTTDPVCALVLEGTAELEEDRNFLSDYSTLLLHRGVLIQMLERCSGLSALKDASIQCYAAIQAIRPRGVVITSVAAVNHALLLSSTGVTSAESQRWHYDALQAVRHARTAPVSQRLTTQQCAILSFNNALLHLHLGNRSGATSAALSLIQSCNDEGIRTACVALLCEVHRITKKSKKTKKFNTVLNRKAVAKKLGSAASPSAQMVLELVAAQHHASCFQNGSVNAIKHLTTAATGLHSASKAATSGENIGILSALAHLLLQSPPPAGAKTAGILPEVLKVIAAAKPQTAAESAAQLSLLQSYLLVLGPNSDISPATKATVAPENIALQNIVRALSEATSEDAKESLRQAGMWPATRVAKGVTSDSLLNDEVIADILRRLPNRIHVDAALGRIAGSPSTTAAPATIATLKIRNRKRPCKALATAAKTGTTTRPDPERWIPLRDRPSYQELPARRRRELHRIRAAAEAEKRRNAEKRRLGQ